MKEVNLERVQLFCLHRHELFKDPCCGCEYEDELCVNKSVHKLKFEDKKTPKIYFDNDQLAVMRQLYSCGFRYIARDDDTYLCAYSERPNKERGSWNGCGSWWGIPNGLFPQILPEGNDLICISDYIDVEKVE